MIKWKLRAYQNNGKNVYYDLVSNSTVVVRETDFITFEVEISDVENIYINLAVVIGDVPCDLSLSKLDGSVKFFNSSDDGKTNVYFRNYFGESEIQLVNLNDGNILLSSKVNILASQDNAKIAKDMLLFINENIDNAAQNCFSRSKKGASIENSQGMTLSKLELIKKIINDLTLNFNLFKKENKTKIETQLIWRKNGKPVGPDAIYLALNHLDQCEPSNINDANLIYVNRGYKFFEVPEENNFVSTDTYENQVINNFLFRAESFLRKILNELYYRSTDDSKIDTSDGFVRFDHVINSFYDSILEYKAIEITTLIKSLVDVRRLILKVIPSNFKTFRPAKITKYVSNKKHYLSLFKHIHQFEQAPSPNFSGNQILMGLKNLSILYEYVTLFITVNTFSTLVRINNIQFDYREHAVEYGFGGISSKKPIGEINNYFLLENSEYCIEIYYEPKIFQYSKHNKSYDYINTSNSYSSSRYGPHHFSPDIFISIKSTQWDEPLVLVFDAKYKDKNTVKDFDLHNLSKKYIYSIHQLGERGNINNSPIKAVFALFAHNRNGSKYFWSKPIHQATGDLPVWPQIGAIHVLHNNSDLLSEQVHSILNYMNKIYKKENQNMLSLVS